ncbi:MAG: site-specific DNA-methyltransferase, partial [Candidatus Sumerlaeia bacterium]|nr:site-specific DNA-methyltransferase [Candidatus Sumerlaeia bacterium]
MKKYKPDREQLQIGTSGSAKMDKLIFEKNFLHNIATAYQGKITVFIGEVRKSLAHLPDESVDCVVTSPPYWRQRDYKHPEQIGQESSLEEYINNLVAVFTELKRVLKSTGTFFLNVGYKYQDKELLLIPELLAMTLQKNGWALVNKIIWHKPNAMPASLQSRFSNVYEPVFIFVKAESKYNYYLSIDELRVPSGNFSNNKKAEDILGLEVRDSLLKAGKIKGYVSKVYQGENGTIIAQINWEDQSSTFEVVQDFDKESQIEIELICEKCCRTIRHEIDLTVHRQCRSFPHPIMPPVINIDNKIELKPSFLFSFD